MHTHATHAARADSIHTPTQGHDSDVCVCLCLLNAHRPS